MMKDGTRELLIGAVGLVKGSVKNGGKAMVTVCDELELEIEQTRFLDGAPFDVISLILRYGTEWGEPELGRINKRHSELEVGIELPMSELRMLEEDILINTVRIAALKCLISISNKYYLNGKIWQYNLAQVTQEGDPRI